jgi:hypothetical protein
MGGGKTVVGLPPPILFGIMEMRGDYEKNTIKRIYIRGTNG